MWLRWKILCKTFHAWWSRDTVSFAWKTQMIIGFSCVAEKNGMVLTEKGWSITTPSHSKLRASGSCRNQWHSTSCPKWIGYVTDTYGALSTITCRQIITIVLTSIRRQLPWMFELLHWHEMIWANYAYPYLLITCSTFCSDCMNIYYVCVYVNGMYAHMSMHMLHG